MGVKNLKDIQIADLQNISVVCDAYKDNEVNDFLDLGWKVLQVTSGYTYEENIEFRQVEKVSYTKYSLGWFGDKEEVKYPDAYHQRTAPF